MKLADLVDDKEEFVKTVKSRLDMKSLQAVAELKKEMASELLAQEEEQTDES